VRKQIRGTEGKSSERGGYNLSERYEVQFQKDCQHHSETNDLEKAEYYARSLANWNLAAQVYDRVTDSIVFRAQAYAGNRTLRSASSSAQ
jgi:hypothetical protein